MGDGVSRAVVALGALAIAGGVWLSHSGSERGGVRGCGPGSVAMQRVELVFGLSRKGQDDVSDQAWLAFLDAEITPRFPDGLTVLAGQGQWRTGDGRIIREPSRLLLVWAKPAPDLAQRIEAVRQAWKAAHGQESVLRAERGDCVSF